MPAAIDGGWGEWGPWTECNRPCGGGVQTMERECTNPAPLNKGRYCLGERKKVKMCNTEVRYFNLKLYAFNILNSIFLNLKRFVTALLEHIVTKIKKLGLFQIKKL